MKQWNWASLIKIQDRKSSLGKGLGQSIGPLHPGTLLEDVEDRLFPETDGPKFVRTSSTIFDSLINAPSEGKGKGGRVCRRSADRDTARKAYQSGLYQRRKENRAQRITRTRSTKKRTDGRQIRGRNCEIEANNTTGPENLRGIPLQYGRAVG